MGTVDVGLVISMAKTNGGDAGPMPIRVQAAARKAYRVPPSNPPTAIEVDVDGSVKLANSILVSAE